MEAQKTITINGRAYDVRTGLPVDVRPKTARPQAKTTAARTNRAANTPKTVAGAVHSAPQRSVTLNRRATKKPGVAQKRPQPGRHMDIARSGSVKRFAPHPVTNEKPQKPTQDVAPKTHPVAAKVHAQHAQKQKPVQKRSSKEIKDAVIAASLANDTRSKTVSKKSLTQRTRRIIMSAGIIALILGAGALAYFQLPGISVAIAAQQAGVQATYPGYVPTGYSLAQPVTFDTGEVVLRFTANSGTGEYTVTQSSSSWDSAAVLDNVVRPASGENYIVTQERGLTMYAYGDNAVWVNGGVLYSIESSAALSGDQIRRIATSL